MTDSIIPIFTKGVHNLIDDESIPRDSAQDSKNFVTQDGRIKLAYGRVLVGAEGLVGTIQGLHWGYKTNGTKVLFRKNDTKVQYLNGSTWTDIITGLTSGAEYSFSNYSSLAGAFVFLSGIDGFYKINTDSPGSYISLYDSAENDKGKIMIDRGRLIMWDCANASKTTLKLSWIDRQNTDVYTTVTNESLGTPGSTLYTGVLGFKTATRNMFGLVMVGTLSTQVETFTDQKDGTLDSNLGGSGTINYSTGAYSVTFGAAAGTPVASYLWEDSTEKGLADFTFSATRVPGEGNRITQDIGGDAILAVEVGLDGAYYSLKEQSAYKLDLLEAQTAPDTIYSNLVYRRDIGIQNWRAVVSTNKGIVFMNTANPDKPELTILQRNPLGDSIEPVVLFPHFKFSNYNYEDCAIDTWERYIVIACKDADSTTNRTVLLCDTVAGTVDIAYYPVRMFAKDSGNLYVGSSVSQSVYNLFNGFDDDGYAIENLWIGKGEQYSATVSERLKKFKKLRFKGLIDPDQIVQVYLSYDDAGFELVGTIRGDGIYVDYLNQQSIGTNMIGDIQVGGDTNSYSYPYFMEIKLKTPKFRKRTLKLLATGIGYFDCGSIMDKDILFFEQRIPSRFRNKQNVSLDGADENQ